MGPALAVHLIESQILREERKAGTNSECPFYRGVRLIEVSVKRESTVLAELLHARPSKQHGYKKIWLSMHPRNFGPDKNRPYVRTSSRGEISRKTNGNT